MPTIESLEKKMWDNYYKQEKLITERSKVPYGDLKHHKLTDQINDLIDKRKSLDKQWNKLKKAEINKEKSKFGIKVGDRVHTVSVGLFLGAGNVIKGTVVMYRGVMKVKLDDPDEFRRKYAPLTKSWRKTA
jgi:dsDNA-specific endonuclease/ATPase MutS2